VTACELISLLDLVFQIKSKSTNELIGISFDFRPLGPKSNTMSNTLELINSFSEILNIRKPFNWRFPNPDQVTVIALGKLHE
jgi:hypothetical protein